ncbi:MAG: HAD family hydrolase [Tannerella sp.]|jgi:Cu2+-exporting ATPase|nr:HAD family hydrolase [Tannerella sp.]
MKKQTTTTAGTTYVGISAAIAVFVFLYWMLIGGLDFLGMAVLALLSVVVAVFPLSLGLAAPIALKAGQEAAAKRHILMDDASVLERLSSIDTLVLSQTGILTQGSLNVVDSYWATEANVQYLDMLYSTQMYTRFQHPMAATIVKWLKDSGATYINCENIEIIFDVGSVTRKDGKAYWLGNRKMVDHFQASVPSAMQKRLFRWKERNYFIAYYGINRTIVASLAIADHIRPEAKQVINILKRQGWDIHLVTSMTEVGARMVANEIGIEHLRTTVSPEGRQKYIDALQRMGKKVALLSGNFDDKSRSLSADLNICLGEPAEGGKGDRLFLPASDLKLLPEALRIARGSMRLLRNDQYIAIAFSLAGILLSTGLLFYFNGLLPNPLWALAATFGSLVVVSLSSLRFKLLR